VRRLFFNPFLLIFVIPIYIGWRLIGALPLGSLGSVTAAAVLALTCFLVPASWQARRWANRRAADRISLLGSTAMSILSTLFALTVLRDVALPLIRLIGSPELEQAFAPWSEIIVLALTLLITLVGFVVALRPRLVEIDIPVTKLPEALRGFSIAQISDVHVGPTIKRSFVERIVERVNALNADLIAVTGDLVDGSVKDLAIETAPFANLRARHGTFFVTGNHEYYSGERAWTQELRRLGMRVLKNEHVVVQHEGAALVVAGVTDVSAHHFNAAERSDPNAALRGAPKGAAKLLLAHQPSSAAAAAQAGFDVQLSGHTHGGQFWPWNLLIGFFQPFTGGLNRLQDLWVYVNRGTGYWGPPNRFGVPSEITRIRLVPAS
jgi:hypothetical protein